MQYPINVNLEGRSCIVLGGGSVAWRKVQTLLAAGGVVRVIAPRLCEELQKLAAQGKIRWQPKCYEQGTLEHGFLLIAATDVPEVNRMATEEAKQKGMLVNTPAQPELSDFTVPASMRRGRLLLTVSTDGLSPACSRFLRRHLEQEFPEHFGVWLERLHVLREEMKEKLPSSREREVFWRNALQGDILSLVKNGELEQAEVRIRNAVDGNRTQS